MLRNIALPLVVLMVVTAAVYTACGTDSAAKTPDGPTPAASPTPAPTTSEPTGVKAVDDAIAAIRSGDVHALIDLMVLEPEACAPPGAGVGGPPACDLAEASGTNVAAVPLFSCEGGWARKESLLQALSPLVQGEPKLFAVYRADEKLFDRSGDYAVIFTYSTAAGDLARNLVMTAEGVVGIDLGCGETAKQMVDRHKLTDAIYLRG